MIGNTETSHFPWYIIGTIDILIEWYYTTTSAAWYKVGAMYPVTSQNVDKPERRFGLSTFRFVDVSVCRRFGLSTFWFVDVLVCRRFGLSTFRFVDVLVCRRFGCRRFGLSTFWPVTLSGINLRTRNWNSNSSNYSQDHALQMNVA